MSSMELFIVISALVASAAGGLILLLSLAGKKAHLVKTFNLQQEQNSLPPELAINEAPFVE